MAQGFPTLLSFPLLATLIGALIVATTPLPRWSRLITTGAVFVSLLLSAGYLIADSYTGRGIDGSVLFHLRQGWEGVTSAVLARLLAAVVAALLLAALVAWLINRRASRQLLPVSSGSLLLLLSLLAPASAFVSILTHPAMADARDLARQYNIDNAPAVADYLVTPRLPPADRRPNFIYIYAESLEGTYFDPERFPGLLPRLEALQERGVRFHGIGQAPMTEWTIAGMTASQCGVPLAAVAGESATPEPEADFDPGRDCLGHMLDRAGYRLVYMGGADLAFSAKGDFYRGQGFDEVYGTSELDLLAGRALPKSEWGTFDDDLLVLAWRKFEELAEAGQPFGLVLLTLDTHPPAGHRTPACARDDIRYAEGDSGMLDAVACADRLIADFIGKVLASPAGRNTVILIGSDHLSMKNDAGLVPGNPDRTNWFVALNTGLAPQAITRQGSTLDLAPTVLELLTGHHVEGLALGRSLLGEAPTLTESLGETRFHQYLHGWRRQLHASQTGSASRRSE